MQCTFTGNADLYGLGIRIGIYLQWFSGLLANRFHADSVHDILATNTIFLMALFIALAVFTANETVRAAEIVILLHFCFGSMFSVYSIWGFRVRARQASPGQYGKRVEFALAGSTLRLCLASFICFYNVWFWFLGIDKFNNEALSDPACHPVGFLFAPVDLFGGVRIFLKITAVVIAIIFGLTTLSELTLFLGNWGLYSVLAALIALLIDFHRTWYRGGSGKKDHSIRMVLLKFSPVIFGGIPWIIMNGKTRVGFKRHRSWFIFFAFMAVFLFCLVIFAAVMWNFIWMLIGNLGKRLGVFPENTKPKNRHSRAVTSRKPPNLQEREVAEERGEERQHGTAKITSLEQHPECVDRNIKSQPPEVRRTNLQEDGSPEHQPPGNSQTETAIEDINLKDSTNPNASKVSNAETLTTMPERLSWSVFPIINLACVIWSIIGIELVIKWNKITDVHTIQSVGQLIPFVIGIVALLKLLRDLSVWWTEFWIYKVVMESFLDFNGSRRESVKDGKEEATTQSGKLLEPPCSQPPPNLTPIVTEMGSMTGRENERSSPSQPRAPVKDRHSQEESPPDSNEHPVGVVQLAYRITRVANPQPTGRADKSDSFYLFLKRFLKEEVTLARDTPMLKDSIGDQIISFLKNDANREGESTEKLNAIHALEVLERFKTEQTDSAITEENIVRIRTDLLEQLRHIGIDPHVLAKRWLVDFKRQWWPYVKLRAKKRFNDTPEETKIDINANATIGVASSSSPSIANNMDT